MKSRIAIAVSALTLGTALAVVPSFAQTNQQTNQRPGGTAAQQGSESCIHFGQGCSDKPYPMNNQSGTEQNASANGQQTGARQGPATRSASSSQRPGASERVTQNRERATGETYRLGERDRYTDYAPGVRVGAAAPSNNVQWCEMRFRSYDPATGTYLGFDGAPHACP